MTDKTAISNLIDNQKTPTDVAKSSCGNKKTINRINTTNSIQKAALKVFAKYGFDGATSKLIAQEAQCSEGLIFKYFVDKQGLFNVIINTWLEYSVAQLKHLKHYPDSLKDQLREIINWFLQLYHKQPELHKIALSQIFLGKLSTKELYQVQQRKDYIISMLRQCKDLKLIRPQIDLECLYDVIQSYAYSETVIKNKTRKQTQAQAEKILEIIFDGSNAK